MVQQLPSGVWTFTGPSGSGKSTLMASVASLFLGTQYIHRHVTRPPKASDAGTNITYVSRATFMEMQRRGQFYESIETHGHLYGVRKEDIDEMAVSKNITLVEFTPPGIKYLWENIPLLNPARDIRSIFLDVRDEELLRERLKGRGDENIEERIIDSRPWYDEARRSFIHYRFIDGRQSKEEVLRQALEFLLTD